MADSKKAQDMVLSLAREATKKFKVNVPNLKPPLLQVPVVRNPLVENVEANYASEFYARLMRLVTDFDYRLDRQHEVGLRLVSFGQAVVFHLEEMGFWNPSLISFKGRTDDGEPVELIQHVTQISILLMKVLRKNPDEPKKPIGFHSEAVRPSGQDDESQDPEAQGSKND